MRIRSSSWISWIQDTLWPSHPEIRWRSVPFYAEPVAGSIAEALEICGITIIHHTEGGFIQTGRSSRMKLATPAGGLVALKMPQQNSFKRRLGMTSRRPFLNVTVFLYYLHLFTFKIKWRVAGHVCVASVLIQKALRKSVAWPKQVEEPSRVATCCHFAAARCSSDLFIFPQNRSVNKHEWALMSFVVFCLLA